MSIVVLSNCQSYGLAEAMRFILPSEDILAYDATKLLGPNRLKIGNDVVNADVVFAMRFPRHFHEFSDPELSKIAKRVITVPSFNFAGFHPDMIYIGNSHRWVQSPTGDYNSNICLAGFLRGFSSARTTDLFNAYVFSKLGYYRAYEDERREAIASFEVEGIRIGHLFER